MKKARNIAIIVGVILSIITLVVDYSAIGTCVTLVSLDIVICIILHVISEKREEKNQQAQMQTMINNILAAENRSKSSTNMADGIQMKFQSVLTK